MHLQFVKTKELSQIMNLLHWIIGLMNEAKERWSRKGVYWTAVSAGSPPSSRSQGPGALQKWFSVCYLFVAGDLQLIQ